MRSQTEVLGIYRRSRAVRTSEGVARLINMYVDQARKNDAISPEEAQLRVPDSERYTALHHRKKLPQRPGVEFIASANPTTVRIEGFLQGLVGGETGNAPQNLAESLKVVSEWWTNKAARKILKATHLIYSISPELQKTLLDARVPVQDILTTGSINSLSRYNSWASPHSSIGYIIGYHSDKPNSHIHALVFPENSKGETLNFSKWAAVNYQGKPIRLDYQGYMAKAYHDFLEMSGNAVTISPALEPVDREQAMTRSSLVALHDFNLIGQDYQSGAGGGGIFQCVTKVIGETARGFKAPEALTSMQQSARADFLKAAPEYRADCAGTLAQMEEAIQQIRKLSGTAGTAGAVARAVASNLQEVQTRYDASPYAYGLKRLAGGVCIPATLTDEWAAKIPNPAISSRNHFFYAIGADSATSVRRHEARDCFAAKQSALSPLVETREQCRALPSLIGFYNARLEEMNAGLTGRTPLHLRTAISNEASPATLSTVDKGFEELKATCLEEAARTMSQHSPFDPVVDNRRDFWRDNEGAGNDDNATPALDAPNWDLGVTLPTAFDPQIGDWSPMQTTLDQAIESHNKRHREMDEQAATGPAPAC